MLVRKTEDVVQSSVHFAAKSQVVEQVACKPPTLDSDRIVRLYNELSTSVQL